MQEFEYGHLHMELIPQEIIERCNLTKLASNETVHFEIQKGMPGLKKEGIIAHNTLSKYLMKNGHV